MDRDRPGTTKADALGLVALLAAFLFGGMAYGLAVAVLVAGGSPGALFVGFMALPLAFGLGMTAWRSVLGAWIMAKLATSMVRSRGDEDRFREEVKRAFAGIRAEGPARLPGTWVFVPAATAVGAVAALATLFVADGARVVAATLLFAGCVAVGVALRRLARAGRLPLPEE